MIHKGTYDGTIYHNPANRFCIISVKTADKEVPLEARSTRRYRDHLIRFVATGYELPRTDAVDLELDGEWKQGKYGMQFQVEQWRQIVPRTKSGVEGYLASGLNQTSKDKPGEHQDKQYRKQKQNDDDGDDLADVLAPGPNGPGHGTIRAAGGSSFCGTGNCLACFNSAFYGVGSGCSGFHGIGKTSLFFFTHLDLVLSAGSGGQLLDD